MDYWMDLYVDSDFGSDSYSDSDSESDSYSDSGSNSDCDSDSDVDSDSDSHNIHGGSVLSGPFFDVLSDGSLGHRRFPLWPT